MSIPPGLMESTLVSALEEAWSRFFHRDEVNGIDIGYKREAGEFTDEIAVRFHVGEKFSNELLAPAQRLPDRVGGIVSDVIAAHPGVSNNFALPDPERTRRHEYLHPGISVSRTACSFCTGTIGAIVEDNFSRKKCLLSSWHVLDATDQDESNPVTTNQPGRIDDALNSPENVIGRLLRGERNSHFDAAVAVLNDGVKYQFQQHGTSDIVYGARAPRIGDVLQKSGRTTGVTIGRVDGIGWYSYTTRGVSRPLFGFRLVPAPGGATEISAGHDSGSLWYDPASREGVGLHCAGEEYGGAENEYAIACLLSTTLSALNVSLIR